MGLVVTCKPGETVYIGADIVVHVVEIRGRQVHLDIEAPPDVPIHRDDAKIKSVSKAR